MGTDEYLHKELSEDLAGTAMTVLNKLRPGLKEKAYENALVSELRKRGHQIEQQRAFDVMYDGVVVDTLVPDLIVDNKMIVDPQCVTDFTETHYAQMSVISRSRVFVLQCCSTSRRRSFAGNVSSVNHLCPSV